MRARGSGSPYPSRTTTLFRRNAPAASSPRPERVIDDTLVSNLSETSSSQFRVGDASGTNLTQGFRTGTFAGGYSLTGVSVVIEVNNFSGSETATLKIYDSGRRRNRGERGLRAHTPPP